MREVDDTHIQFDERFLSAPAQFRCSGGILDYAPEAVGRTAQYPIEIDRLEVRFGRPRRQRGPIQIEVKDCGFESGHALLKRSVRGERQAAFEPKA